MTTVRRLAIGGWLLLCALLSSGWCLSAAAELGPTYDEVHYFRAGLQCWNSLCHKYLTRAGTMPLPIELQTLPLFVLEKTTDIDPRQDLLHYLPWCRAMTLTFWWLLLASTFWAARRWGNSLAGCVAVALVASQPIMLGHATLATTDLPLTAATMVLAVAYRLILDRVPEPRRQRRWAAGVVAFAMLTKASALVFAPVCLFAVELDQRWREGWRPRWQSDSWLPIVSSIRTVLTIHLLGNLLTLLLCPRLIKALVFQIAHNFEGHAIEGNSFVYLLGQTSPYGFWYYFPAALASKVTLATLAFVALALVLRPLRVGNPLMLAAAGLLVLSPVYRVQLGVRFVLPVVAFATAGAAVALFGDFGGSAPGRWRRRWSLAAAAGLIAASTWEAGYVWPHGLCYTNQLFGGTARGYLTLCESNYDWGQGVDDLLAWYETEGRPPTSVWYFGTDPRVGELPITSVDGTQASVAEFQATNQGRYVAVSLTYLYGYAYHTPVGQWLRDRAPSARTQTFLIYDLRAADRLARAGDSDPPLTIFRR